MALGLTNRATLQSITGTHHRKGRCIRETFYVVDDEHRHWTGTRFSGYATAGDVITLTRKD